MKKTIAILLVLVIGMAGVFAAEADIAITTKVTPINGIIVTGLTNITALTSSSTYVNFTDLASSAFDTVNDDPIVVGRPTNANDYTDIGYLHYYSNQSASFKTTLTADPLTSAAGTITSVINYTVDVDSETYHTGDPGTEITLRTGTETTSTIGTKTISVMLDADDWDSAMVADDYEGVITFEFTAV